MKICLSVGKRSNDRESRLLLGQVLGWELNAQCTYFFCCLIFNQFQKKEDVINSTIALFYLLSRRFRLDEPIAMILFLFKSWCNPFLFGSVFEVRFLLKFYITNLTNYCTNKVVTVNVDDLNSRRPLAPVTYLGCRKVSLLLGYTPQKTFIWMNK